MPLAKDHLGNERAVVDVNKNIYSSSSYYPFGLPMQKAVTNYRYSYQGEFTEDEIEETGWNSFEARMYDPVIGRWMAMDPARQFASPYWGMGNNPVNQIDPDGRNGVPIVDKDGGITYVLPEVEIMDKGPGRSWSQGFWDFMSSLDNLVKCNSCIPKNPFPIQIIVIDGKNGSDPFNAKADPTNKTIYVYGEELEEMQEMMGLMTPGMYGRQGLKPTLQSNPGVSNNVNLNDVAVAELSARLAELVHNYSGVIESIFIRQVEYRKGVFTPDTVDSGTARKYNYADTVFGAYNIPAWK